MIAWLKAKLWPCKHGVKMLSHGLIVHKSLMVSSTHTGNVYRCTVKCRRCQTVVVRFEGTLQERDEQSILLDPPILKTDRDLWA